MRSPIETLDHLEPGQPIVYGGDRVTRVGAELAAAFRNGDRIVVDDLGQILHVPAAEIAVVDRAVSAAAAAFTELPAIDDDQITEFFLHFAERLADRSVRAELFAANAADVGAAQARQRSITRLELTDSMLTGMIAGLSSWAAGEQRSHAVLRTVEHQRWTVEVCRAPLGVVGFVFEGRPNVFADAVGVLRTGNTVVMRIGSDALGTARAIVELALAPALRASGLPVGSVALVESPERAAGWALFGDRRVALAVARGSGPAVAQLGSVARQSGVPVSLHGTGGAWLVVDETADAARLGDVVRNSLDRKVCNTLNVCCLLRSVAPRLVPIVVDALEQTSAERGVDGRLHATRAALEFVPSEAQRRAARVVRSDGEHDEPFVTPIAVDELGREWEWEASPELSVHVVDSIDEAIALCNRTSPRFIASLLSSSPEQHERFYAAVEAPFVGDGFTRWVDGQYALDTPELGLSNWEHGRLLARGAILAGDGVHTLRYRARFADSALRR